MKIGVLAVQGAFIEHINRLKKLGVDCFEIRQKKDLEQAFDGLILPGGESTVQGKLLRELDLFDPLKQQIENDLPTLATCAGLILLAKKLSGDDTVHFQTMPVTVLRNAYGRQLGSFHTKREIKGIGEVPMTFIRAPYIERAGSDVDILAQIDGKIVAARYKNQLGLSFHPELDDSDQIHQYFLSMVQKAI